MVNVYFLSKDNRALTCRIRLNVGLSDQLVRAVVKTS
jgi:hypothetical protein